MRRYENLHPNNGALPMIVEEYENFAELINTLNSRSIVWTDCSHPSRDEYDPDFKRCESFEEATDLLLHGFDENVAPMLKHLRFNNTGECKKRKRFQDVVGYAPIVPNALMGLPLSMVNSTKKRMKSKVIKVLYDPGVLGSVSTREVMDYGCDFINYVLSLERSGYRVRVDYVKPFNPLGCDKQYILRVPLKNERQPLNVKRMSFALTNAAMQRYISWDWVERLPNSTPVDSFGASISGGGVEECKRNLLQHYLKPDEVFVCYGTDLDTVFNAYE